MSTAPSDRIDRILVAVDGSEFARRAVRVASRIAKNNLSELTVLHVMTIPYAVFSGEAPYSIDKVEESARLDAEKFIAEAVEIARQYGVEPKTAIREHVDSPVRGITEYAEENSVDLIVVGTRGLGDFKRLVLGSVASGVVHYAHCSVTVVR